MRANSLKRNQVSFIHLYLSCLCHAKYAILGNYHGCLEKADAECNWKLFYSIYLLDPTFYAKRVFKTYKSGNFQWNVLDGSKVKEPWIHMFWEQLKVLNHGKPIHKDF